LETKVKTTMINYFININKTIIKLKSKHTSPVDGN